MRGALDGLGARVEVNKPAPLPRLLVRDDPPQAPQRRLRRLDLYLLARRFRCRSVLLPVADDRLRASGDDPQAGLHLPGRERLRQVQQTPAAVPLPLHQLLGAVVLRATHVEPPQVQHAQPTPPTAFAARLAQQEPELLGRRGVKLESSLGEAAEL